MGCMRGFRGGILDGRKAVIWGVCGGSGGSYGVCKWAHGDDMGCVRGFNVSQ